jgi:hypothetical protein
METLHATIVPMDPHRIDTELEKANVTSLVLAHLRERAEPLIGKPITNGEEYDAVHAAEQACVKVRTTAISICKRERDPAIAYQKAVIAKEKEVVAEIEAIEAPLKQLKAEYNAIAQKRMAEDAARYDAQLKARKARMFEIGFRFDGTAYVLDGFASLTEAEVTGSDVIELQLGEWLNDIERQVNEHKERELEKARTAQIAADALAAQQKAEADRVAAIAAQQEAKAKELADKEAAMNAKILSARRAELKAVGSVDRANDAQILAMDDNDFAVYVVGEKGEADHRAKLQREADAKAEAERKANEERIAAEAVKRAEDKRLEDEAREKEEAAEREAKMTDAAKFRAYHAALMAVKVPVMTSRAGKKRIVYVVAQLGSMLKS